MSLGPWGGVLLGAMLLACGPINPDEAGDAASEALSQTSGSDNGQGLAAQHLEPTGFLPAPVARGTPSVAFGKGKYLVVWEDERDGGVYGTRVRTDGTLLDPGGLRLNPRDVRGFQPVAAFNGTHFFVVWQAGTGISGVRVATDGTQVGPVFDVIPPGTVSLPLGLACSPEVCTLTYNVVAEMESIVSFTRVRSDGAVLSDMTSSVSPAGNLAGESSVAWNNNQKQFLIVWIDARGGRASPDIYGARLQEDGTLLDAGGFPISQAPGSQRRPDVTWTGRRYHVVWGDDRNGTFDIYGARVRSNGTVEDPAGIAISTASGEQTLPRVAHHESKSLVVWDDTRDGPHRIWGARLGEDGSVWDRRLRHLPGRPSERVLPGRGLWRRPLLHRLRRGGGVLALWRALRAGHTGEAQHPGAGLSGVGAHAGARHGIFRAHPVKRPGAPARVVTGPERMLTSPAARW
ncbi:hypothetical protein [Pyxidicoccus parkwayensis]|uniref:hypothetical protein n=1 Tax=Pyxidicoccus parkwayensis TaxID=2813578 RepID=UPI001F51467A|nr:hypothetical protein [Pyxidicoccus parkwaysis]